MSTSSRYVINFQPSFAPANTIHPPQKLTRKESYSDASILLIAGSETTATTLSGDLIYLCSSPDVLKKLTDEVRGNFMSEEEINFQGVSRLPYLGACPEEGFRLFLPVLADVPRITPPGGTSISGKYVLGGVGSSYSHRAER